MKKLHPSVTIAQTTLRCVDHILTLNSIHSESINLRLIKKYKKFAPIVNFTHVDLCLDWGSMFNCMYLEDIPISYLSRGVDINSGVDKLTDETLFK